LAQYLIPGTVAAALSLRAIGRWALWRNEIASVTVAQRSVPGIFHVLRTTDAPLGLYYLLLHFWLRIGNSELIVRLPSLIAGITAVLLTVAIGRRLFGSAVGVGAGLLLAVSPLATNNAVEARPYALMMAAVTCSTLLLLRAVRSGAAADRWWYAAVSVFAVYAHFLAILVIVAHVAALAIHGPAAAVVRRFTWPMVVIGVLSTPLVFFAATRQSEEVAWIPPLAPHGILQTATAIAGSGALLAVLAAAVVLGLRRVYAGRRRRADSQAWGRRVITLWLLLPPVALIIVSVVRPLLVPRYLTDCLPALALLGAYGISLLPRQGFTVAAVAATASLCAAAVVGTVDKPYRTEDPRALARDVLALSKPGDAIVFAPAYARDAFEYYLNRASSPNKANLTDVALLATPEAAGSLYAKEIAADVLQARLAPHHRVWLIGYGGLLATPTTKTPEPMIAVEHRPIFRSFRRTRLLVQGAIHAQLLQSATPAG
jgi:mannosyltransferase